MLSAAGESIMAVCPNCGSEFRRRGAMVRCRGCSAAHKTSPEYREQAEKKRAAQCALSAAVLSGVLERRPCEAVVPKWASGWSHYLGDHRCGNTPTHGHHEDYSRPLDV